MKPSSRALSFFSGLLFMYGCSSSYKLSNRNVAALYDPEYSYLHPQYIVYHYREDSSKLFIRIATSELLYKKNDAGVNAARVTVSYKLFNSIESKLVIDSASVVLNDYNESNNTSGILIHSVNFKTPVAGNYVMEAEMKDNFRQQSTLSLVQVDKSGKQSAQRFLLKLKDQNVPAFRNYVQPDEAFNILTPDPASRKMFVRCYFKNFPLASPPFSETVPVKFEYAADSIFTMDVSPSTDIRLERKGIYHFQYDTLTKQGFTVFRFDEDFPRITDAGQMLEALRFITTKPEYDNLYVAADKKAAIDKFWLDLSGNESRGKVLIRKYYTRVQNANRIFTSYLEGWKTDRGLVYTIFGPPTSVYKSSTAESWTYGNFNYNNSLTFNFEKIYNPFSDSDYILRRSEFYQTPWYRAVDRWRQGVVVND